ncbi:ATP-binding cassette, subfamily B [Bifidobacterium bohemicum]|uniref:ABC-type multidrug transport system, ATPase and permease component n=1 Tax=Bifidobacterium bohemicum DSM 22767 TaxID=1437606 RepID=A0A086ZHE1_9BIFI|nr:ABC transporter ATP-binding protein [Bifidobacterium bohemicum]KFI45941.1 ABC-type multidrug transport system, ATPase and permease component [Bifidobacterium bohemicum DSM 22767]SCC14552.1 ATP-binding cassette, subfamily B [Bifidobacterium bohemicum]
MFRISRYLSKTEIGQLILSLAFIAGQVFFDLKLPDYMSSVTKLVETPGSRMADIFKEGGKMLLVSLGSVVCAIIVGYLTARVGASFSQRLRSLEFRKVESFGPAEMHRFSTASLITRSTNDVTQIQMFITMGVLLIFRAPIMAVWAIVKIAGKGFEWTAATAIATVIVLLFVIIVMALVMPKFRSMQRLTDNINAVARENLTGLRVVRAYNAEAYQENKFSKVNDELTNTQLFTTRAMAAMNPVMSSVMNGLGLSIYWIGAYLIKDAMLPADKLTHFSNMVVFSSYAMQVIMAFLLLSMVFVLWPRADVSAQRVLEVLGTEPSVISGSQEAGLPGHAGEVEFRDVSFAYPGTRDTMLSDVSFKARKGQTVAFIGSTGSGKSTLVNLVPRFYDVTDGQVLVDGVNVRDYDLKALRDKIGYVPQQSVMFKGTVASNVTYGDRPGDKDDPKELELADTSTAKGRKREAALIAASGAAEGLDLTPEQRSNVRIASEVAQADEFVDRMDGGYDAPIAQGGSNVSGGQKQRLSIARAVYRHPEIMIFDDSFSALDFKTDRAVRDALKREAGDATRLIVAQRVGTIMDADTIVVLDDGRVVGEGTHKELLDTCEVYRQIAQSQLTPDELAG